MRTHELKAYVIYVKPPSLERLRESRQGAYVTTSYYINRPFKVSVFIPFVMKESQSYVVRLSESNDQTQKRHLPYFKSHCKH